MSEVEPEAEGDAEPWRVSHMMTEVKAVIFEQRDKLSKAEVKRLALPMRKIIQLRIECLEQTWLLLQRIDPESTREDVRIAAAVAKPPAPPALLSDDLDDEIPEDLDDEIPD